MNRVTLCFKLFQMQKGNVDAFEDIYKAMYRPIYAIAYSIVHDKFLADDVVHDTFIRIYTQISKFDGRNALGWIYSIAHNTALNMQNQRIREQTEDDVELYCEPFKFEDDISNKDLINRLFRELKEDERLILLYHIIGGLKFGEISNLYNIPIGTILSKYNRTIKKLRQKVVNKND